MEFLFGTGDRGKGTNAACFTADCCVLGGITSDLILGIPFLRHKNPQIDWAEASLTFPQRGVHVRAQRIGRPQVSLCSMQQVRAILRREGTENAHLALIRMAPCADDSTDNTSTPAPAPPATGAVKKTRWSRICADFADVFGEPQDKPRREIEHRIIL